MNSKVKYILKDTAVGMGIGTAIIIPGISGGTIALIAGSFKKIVDAVDGLFSKLFWKNLLILLPFGIGAVLAIAGLIFPIKLAFDHCMLALTILFAAFMVGSVPSLYDSALKKRKDDEEKLDTGCVVSLILGFAIVIGFGVLSICVNLDKQVLNMFDQNPFYLYPILFGVGLISAMGLIVPGFSGSMLLMVLGFYDKILIVVLDTPKHPGLSLLRLAVFALGVAIGFVFFSKLMKYMFEHHERTTNCIVLGFLVGSIIAIFINSKMFNYFKEVGVTKLDIILSPIFAVIGLSISLAIYFYMRKHPEAKEEHA